MRFQIDDFIRTKKETLQEQAALETKSWKREKRREERRFNDTEKMVSKFQTYINDLAATNSEFRKVLENVVPASSTPTFLRAPSLRIWIDRGSLNENFKFHLQRINAGADFCVVPITAQDSRKIKETLERLMEPKQLLDYLFKHFQRAFLLL